MTEPPPQDSAQEPAGSSSKAKTTRYSAPALEKGLQILELLADQESGLSQNQIAQQLGRSVNEIFRMLNCLEQFGYIYRQRPEDLYYLTLKLFELGHHQPPLKRLLMAAQQPMRKLVNQIRSSCHLTVLHNNQMMVVARQDSPEPLSFIARLGSLYSLASIPAGRVMLAFQPPELQAQWLQELAKDIAEWGDPTAFRERLALIRQRGYEHTHQEVHQGVVSLSFPIQDSTGLAHAALTVPLIITTRTPPDVDTVIALTAAATEHIQLALGWLRADD